MNPTVVDVVDLATAMSQRTWHIDMHAFNSVIATSSKLSSRIVHHLPHAQKSVSDALYSFKLLEALRNGDAHALQPFLTASADPATGQVNELTSPLHMAVRCAEDSTIALILRAKGPGGIPAVNLNAQESQHGNTALHIASLTGRAETVKLLLDQPGIDDTKRSKEGKEPLEVAATPAVAQLFQGEPMPLAPSRRSVR